MLLRPPLKMQKNKNGSNRKWAPRGAHRNAKFARPAAHTHVFTDRLIIRSIVPQAMHAYLDIASMWTINYASAKAAYIYS